MIPLLLAACGGLGEGIEVPPPPTYVSHVEDGFALRMPEGARVRRTDKGLSVDAADGARWFDVRWVDGTAPPIAPATAWAEERCRPVRFDRARQPVEGTWVVGGTCTIAERRHWILLSIEDRGDRALLTGLTGAFGRIAYEDLWVEFVHTALSVQAGESPAAWMTPEAVREALRTVAPGDPQEEMPVPGGGTFSARVTDNLPGIWADRRDAVLPERLAAP